MHSVVGRLRPLWISLPSLPQYYCNGTEATRARYLVNASGDCTSNQVPPCACPRSISCTLCQSWVSNIFPFASSRYLSVHRWLSSRKGGI